MFIEVTDRENEDRILLNTASVSIFEGRGQIFHAQTKQVEDLGTTAFIATPYRDEITRLEGGDRIILSESFDRVKELLREAGELA